MSELMRSRVSVIVHFTKEESTKDTKDTKDTKGTKSASLGGWFLPDGGGAVGTGFAALGGIMSKKSPPVAEPVAGIRSNGRG